MKTTKPSAFLYASAFFFLAASAARASDGYALWFDTATDTLTTTNKITTVAFTVEFWVRPSGWDGTERNVIGQYAGGTGRTLFQVKGWKARLFHGGGNGPANEIIGATTLANDAWTYLAYTRDETGLAKIYVNGVPDGQANLGTTLPQTDTTLRVGGFASNALPGLYSELRVWSFAKTAAEIAASMRTRAAGDEPGLVLHLPLDDPFNNTAADTVTGARYSTAGETPVFRDDLPFDFTLPAISAACTNRAFVLTFTNGTANAYADFQSNVRITNDGPFTVEGWVRPEAFGGEAQIFCYGATGADRFKMRVNDTNGVLRLQFGEYVMDAASAFRTNEWFHFAAVRETGGVSALYLNGERAARRRLNTTTNVNPATALTLGSSLVQTNAQGVLSGENPFRGDLCEFRVWHGALTGEQIRSNLFTRVAGDEPGLAYWWDMDENSATRVRTPSGDYFNGPTGVGVLYGGISRPLRADVPVAPIAAPGHALHFTNGTHIVTTSARIVSGSFTVEMWARFDSLDNDTQHANGEFQLFNQDLVGDPARLFLHVRRERAKVLMVVDEGRRVAKRLDWQGVRENQGRGA